MKHATRKIVLLRGLLACSVFFAAGCAMIDAGYNDRPRSQLGRSIDALTGATNLAFCGDRLVVATNGRGQGIAVVDTGSDVATAFYPLENTAVNVACDSSGLAYLVLSTYPGAHAGLLDLNAHAFHAISTALPSPESRFSVSDGRRFLIDRAGGFVQPLTSGSALQAQGTRIAIRYPTDIVTWGDYALVASDFSRRVRVAPLGGESAAASDSITAMEDSAYPGRIWMPSLVVWKDKAFVIVNLGDAADSSYVAVLDVSACSLLGTIPLSFGNASSGGIRNGLWYVYESGIHYENHGGPPVLDGGVEAIDLEQAVHAGTLATEAQIGCNIRDFVAGGDHSGYVLCDRNNGRTTQVVKVRY